MSNFIEKLLSLKPLKIPSAVTKAFKQQFPQAYNCEWSTHHQFYEVIFYQNDQECIAGFKQNGAIMFIKRNLKLEAAPDLVVNAITPKWELMNLLEIVEENLLHYECIVRDNELIRYALYIDHSGNIVQEEKL